jgi:hypothetical protein
MTVSEQLQASERELRRAVARRQYGGLTGKLEDLRRIVDEDIADLQASDPRRQEIVGWMLANIKWAQIMLATQRQICLGQLKLLPKVGRYLDDPDRGARTMCLDL